MDVPRRRHDVQRMVIKRERERDTADGPLLKLIDAVNAGFMQ